MMKKKVLIIAVVLSIALVFSAVSYADSSVTETRDAGKPTLTVIGNTAKCRATVNYSGSYIEATLELWQGSTLIASWANTGTGSVTVSGNATIVHGLTYTLTVSGTAGGTAFAPQSITRTL